MVETYTDGHTQHDNPLDETVRAAEGPDLEQPVEVTVDVVREALISLRYIGVGLLALAGVVDIHTARDMADLRPMDTAEKAKLKRVLKWMKDTGAVGLPLGTYLDWERLL